MIRLQPRRVAAPARAAGTALLSIAVLCALFVLAIGTVIGERRR